MAIIQLINYALFIGFDYETIYNEYILKWSLAFLFTSEYNAPTKSKQDILKYIWWITNILAIIITFFFG